MNNDSDEMFEKRLRYLLSKTKDIRGMDLSSERLQNLRALIPIAAADCPYLSLVWKRLTTDAAEGLSVLKVFGLRIMSEPAPLLRSGENNSAHHNTVLLPLSDGELLARIIPGECRTAKVLLSARGMLQERGDLYVELSFGKKLVEARPLEQKAEVTLPGVGIYRITLFAGDAQLGTISFDIGAEEDSGDA